MKVEIRDLKANKSFIVPDDNRLYVSSSDGKIDIQVRTEDNKIVVVAMKGRIVVENRLAYPAVLVERE